MAKKQSSVEEQVEDWGKSQLSTAGIHYYTKTETINEVIAAALKAAPSKSGGSGNNYPDIKTLLVSPKNPDRHLPVMMEAKGTKGKLVKLANDGTVANTKQGGEPNYTNINGYAVNGAVHYAQAIVNNSDDVYPECLAIGLNGYEEDEELLYEVEVWYVDKDNFALPKKIGNYPDLSFLFPAHQEALFEELDRCVLTEEEIEAQRFLLETEFDGLLADYNQYLHDDLHITANNRIALTVGLILAGIGAPGVSPLQFTDFKGETGSTVHDGMIVYNKIQSFLEAKHLPQSELRTVMNYLEAPFTTATYYTPSSPGSFSKIALAHQATQKILPLLLSTHRIDYMGRLFNKLLAWAALADDANNDVVLTPRYITNFMARLGRVDMNSYVWDWAAGTGGFLVSAMNMMMADAEDRISSPDELEKKKQSIRVRQLLGIEIRGDIYLLNLLNMLLLDGSFANVIQADSLNKKQFDGDYPYSAVPEPFPANVFLLNPPYSAAGKGLNFVERALNKMKSGYGVVITQENAGGGMDDGYGAKILAKHSLVASIHMPLDLFHGKSSVQTAIFVFRVGKPHDPESLVKFIDMGDDGYVRTDRKKNKKVPNLHNRDHATERYDEVVNLVLGKKTTTDFYKSEHYIEDTISIDGNDWTYKQHQNLERELTETDFLNTIGDYLEWRLTAPQCLVFNEEDTDE